MISEVVTGTNAYATSPIRPAFWGFIDTALLDDLEAVASFINTSNYAQQTTVLDAEWGSTGKKNTARLKLLVIDLEAYGISYGDKGQARAA